MEFYLLNYFKPATGRMTSCSGRRSRAHEGDRLHGLPSAGSHRSTPTGRIADVEDGARPRERHLQPPVRDTSRRSSSPTMTAIPIRSCCPAGARFVVKNIFTDLKRHDLGPAFHERNHDGTFAVPVRDRAAVGRRHDGAHTDTTGAASISRNVILRHGGEAQAARDAFAALSERGQQSIVEFLQTLVLFPPDDTSSNLNPGVPGEEILRPSMGASPLSALFQIPDPDGLGEIARVRGRVTASVAR
jgi:hypothetical protein